MQVEMWPLTRLVLYARNPRKNDHVVARMVSSIKEFGFKVPVLARSSGEVIDGHLRLKAAEKLGITEIPVILCDDWSDAQVKAFRLCGQTRPNLMATDPPYGVGYDPSWRVEVDGGGRHALGKVENDDQVDWTSALRLFTGDVAYVWHAGVHAGEVASSLHSIGFQIRAQIIWSKQHFVFGRGNYHWGHEPCWYAVRKGKKSNWRGDRTQSTVWEVKNLNPHGGNKDEQQTGHGTQKPVELMRRPILNHTERGDVVYDPFLGSGSSMIAAEQTGRVCYGLDIDPKYVDVAVLRGN